MDPSALAVVRHGQIFLGDQGRKMRERLFLCVQGVRSLVRLTGCQAIAGNVEAWGRGHMNSLATL